ncbi:hypothetical protein Glove_106g16 [Diversispora epigaea]|uniref:Uncharacterized protein n=1 Tax=Diversispora epigaea TaxID=1348612 RepID=A0A397J6K9_9GLOM|nr:hypothetical protein Glove_106g16 [Diversispora epigaea]
MTKVNHAFQFLNDNRHFIELHLQKSKYPEIINKLLHAEEIMASENPRISKHESKAYQIFKYYEPYHIHAQFRVCDYEFNEICHSYYNKNNKNNNDDDDHYNNINNLQIQQLIQRLQKPIQHNYHHAKYLLSGIYFLNPNTKAESDKLLKEVANWELVVEEEQKVYINAEARIEYAFDCLVKNERNYELGRRFLYDAYCTNDEVLCERVKRFMRDCSISFNKPVPEWAK